MNPVSRTGRRTFITRGCAVGIGIALAPQMRAQPNAADECKASVADALLLFDEILFDVQGEAITNAVKPVLEAGRSCANALETLTGLVEKLQKEICKPSSGSTTSRMQELVDVGSSNIKILKASLTSGSDRESALVIGAIGRIAEQIDQAAQDVRMKCVLTPQGETLLHEIFENVKKAKEIPDELRKAQDKYSTDTKRILCQVKAVRQCILGAATAIGLGTADPPSRSTAKFEEVRDNIQTAVCLLHKLDPEAVDPATTTGTSGTATVKKQPFKVTNPIAHQMTKRALPKCDDTTSCEWEAHPAPQGKPAQVLMQLLRGAEKVFQNPAAGYFEISLNTLERDASLIPASYRSPGVLPVPHVGDLLNAYCRPYTYARRAVLTTAVGIARASTTANSNERWNAIYWIVYKFKCDEPSNRLALVSALFA